VSVHDLASILGLLSWALSAVDFTQSHYRHLQRQRGARDGARWYAGEIGFVPGI
jgi:hypothetical protein